jgi:hypothetical protein
MPKKINFNNPPLTKKRFEALLGKAAKPVSEWQHEQAGKEITDNRPSDGCIETGKNQDNPEGKEG